MQIALVDGIRSLPTPEAKGYCPACNRPMVAKCGEKIIWHWAHQGRRKCDPWWENEGPWHRDWKSYFPIEWHEIVRWDDTGEKHIADVMLPSGLVVELQHSSMKLEEMRSREAFYDNMIWIVDASPFKKNITVFSALPDPSETFVTDLKFVKPMAEWRNSWHREEHGFSSFMFFRRSERDPNSQLQLLHTGREINEHFPDKYSGHHLYYWSRPREIWTSTMKPTFLDFGEDVIARLMHYGPKGDDLMCLQFLYKRTFIDLLTNSPKNLSDVSLYGAWGPLSRLLT